MAEGLAAAGVDVGVIVDVGITVGVGVATVEADGTVVGVAVGAGEPHAGGSQTFARSVARCAGVSYCSESDEVLW